jgi:predicted GNAT family N-acyltransferase
MATLITTPADQDLAYAIRMRVFVEEQKVPAEEEVDEYEPLARHFLEVRDGKAVGTARWRYTDKGIKLERFAVLGPCRGLGVGRALLEAVLADVTSNPDSEGKVIYLHAQLTAEPFYAASGFVQEGEVFYEAGIAHVRMVKA